MRLLLTLPLLLLAACTSLTGDIRVSSRQLADIDLSELQVYEWTDSAAHVVDTTGSWADGNFDLNAALREAVERQLGAIGLTPVGSGALLRVEAVAVGTRQQAIAEGGAGDGSGDAPVTEGSLLVKILHVPTDALVWRGTARSTAHRVHSPAEAKLRVEHAVREMFRTLRR
jgi:hypothetical protein